MGETEMRPTDNRFSAGIASLLLQPSSNPLDSIGKGFRDVGKIADTQHKKEQFDLDFSVKHNRIKEKIEDHRKLAKLMSSGADFDSFVTEHGEFKTPTAVKIARDFTDKSKTLMNREEQQKQLAFLSADPRFNQGGKFDYGKATDYMSSQIRKGEIDPVVGAKLIDGLHRAGGYGIYSTTKPIRGSSNTSANSKLIEKGKATLLAKALKIKDPTKQAEAIAKIGNVSDMEQLGALGALVQQSDTDASISVDKKKASQKYAVQVGNFLSTSKRLDALIDDYDPEFTGMLDTAQEDALQGTNLADPKYTAYKKNMGNVFLDFKELNNMGANFTKSEQEMMRNAMPNLNSSDAEYQRDMIDFTKLIRDKVKSKIIALDSAHYNTGELKKVIDYYDNLVERAEAKFGGGTPSGSSTSSTSGTRVVF